MFFNIDGEMETQKTNSLGLQRIIGIHRGKEGRKEGRGRSNASGQNLLLCALMHFIDLKMSRRAVMTHCIMHAPCPITLTWAGLQESYAKNSILKF